MVYSISVYLNKIFLNHLAHTILCLCYNASFKDRISILICRKESVTDINAYRRWVLLYSITLCFRVAINIR